MKKIWMWIPFVGTFLGLWVWFEGGDLTDFVDFYYVYFNGIYLGLCWGGLFAYFVL